MTCGVMSASDEPAAACRLPRPDLVGAPWEAALAALGLPPKQDASPNRPTVGQLAQDIIDSETSCATVLPHATASVFGDAPAWDEFATVRCVKCDTLLLPVAYAHHLSKHAERTVSASQLPHAKVVVNNIEDVALGSPTHALGRDDGGESCADEFVRALLSPDHSASVQPTSPPVNVFDRLLQTVDKKKAGNKSNAGSARTVDADVLLVGTVKGAGGKTVRARKSVVPPPPPPAQPSTQDAQTRLKHKRDEITPPPNISAPDSSSNAYVVASAGATRLRLKITKASSQATPSPTPADQPAAPTLTPTPPAPSFVCVEAPSCAKAADGASEETRGSSRRKQRLSVSNESDGDVLTCVSPQTANAGVTCSATPSTSSVNPATRPFDLTFTALGAKHSAKLQGDTRERIRTVAAILRQKKTGGSVSVPSSRAVVSVNVSSASASNTPPPVVCTTAASSAAAGTGAGKLSTSRPVLPSLLMPSVGGGTRNPHKPGATVTLQHPKHKRLVTLPVKCSPSMARISTANGFVRVTKASSASGPKPAAAAVQKAVRTVRRKSVSPRPAVEPQWATTNVAWLSGHNGTAPLYINLYQLRRANNARSRLMSALPSERPLKQEPVPVVVPASNPSAVAVSRPPPSDYDSPPVLEAVANFATETGSANAHCHLPPLSPVSSPLNEVDWKGRDDACTPPMGMIGLNARRLNTQPSIIPLSPVQQSHQDVSILSISPADGDRGGAFGDPMSASSSSACGRLHSARIIPLSPITDDDPAGAPTPPMTTHSDVMPSSSSAAPLHFDSCRQLQHQQHQHQHHHHQQQQHHQHLQSSYGDIAGHSHNPHAQSWCSPQASWYETPSSQGNERLAQTPTPPMVLMHQPPGAEPGSRVYTLTPVSFAPGQHVQSGSKRTMQHSLSPHMSTSTGGAKRARLAPRPSQAVFEAHPSRPQRQISTQHTITTAPLQHARHAPMHHDQYNQWNKYKAGTGELQRSPGIAPTHSQQQQYWGQTSHQQSTSGFDTGSPLMMAPTGGGMRAGAAVGRNVFVSKMAATQLMQQQQHHHQQQQQHQHQPQMQHAVHAGRYAPHAAQPNVVYGHQPMVQQHSRSHAEFYGSEMMPAAAGSGVGRMVLNAPMGRPNVVFATAAGDQPHGQPQHMS